MTPPEPGILGPTLPLTPLGVVSPSHFDGLRECALRETWGAARVPRLLPLAPAARVGTVSHRLLEEAGSGAFAGQPAAAIAARWDELVASAEVGVAASWLDRHLLPLSAAVPDYEVRRLQALAAATALTAEAASHARGTAAGRAGVGFELRVASRGGEVAGRIDAAVPSDAGAILRDYKTGTIRDSGTDGAINPAYATQLKLYAALYQATEQVWPARLELVPVSGPPVAVPFDPTECTTLLEGAIGIRTAINRVIEADLPLTARIGQLASPDPHSCRFCAFRPRCEPYRFADHGPGEQWPHDAWGTVVEQQVLGNGRRLLALDDASGARIYIRGLSSDQQRHPALELLVAGDNAAAFNLRWGGSEASFSEGPATTIYKVEPATSGSAQ